MGHQNNSIWAIRSKLHQTCFQQCFLGQMQVKTPALVAVINQMPVHTYRGIVSTYSIIMEKSINFGKSVGLHPLRALY